MKKTTILEMNRLSVEEFHDAEKMPLIVVLDDVRSLYNVGSVLRTADAFRVECVYMCGITAPPLSEGDAQHRWTMKVAQEIHKTALGAEESVEIRYFKTALEAVKLLQAEGYKVLAVEQAHGSTMLQEFTPQQKQRYAIVMGNEVKGVHQEVVDQADGCLELPQYGTKHSLNVSVTAGIAIWHFAEQFIVHNS